MSIYDDILSGETKENQPERSKYDALLDDDRQFQKQNLQQNIYNSADKQPDKQAEYLKLSKELGLPLGVVERNYDAVSKKHKVVSNNYDQLVDQQPATSTWLKKPENAAIGHDDIDNLSKVETLSKFKMPEKKSVASYLPEGFRPAVETGLNSLAISAVNLAAATGKLSPEDASQTIANLNSLNRDIRDRAPSFVKDWQGAMTKEGADRQRAWASTVDSYDRLKKEQSLEALKDMTLGGIATVGETLDFIYEISLARPKGLAYSTVENLTRMSPNFLLAAIGAKTGATVAAVLGQAGPQAATPEEIVTVPLAATFGGAAGFFAGGTLIETGAWIQQRIDEKVEDPTDPEQLLALYKDPKFMAEIRAEGLRKGATTAAVDAIFNAFAGKILTGQAVKAAPTIAKKVTEAGKAAAKELTTQAAGESISEAAGQVAAYKGDIGRVDFNDVIAEGVLSLGHSGTEIAIGTSRRLAYDIKADRAAAQIVKDNERAFQAIQQAEQLQALNDLSIESKVNQRSPEAFGELIDYAAENNSQDIFFQTDDFDSYWNRKGESPAAKAEELTGSATAYQEAKQSGLDLQIPLKDYITKLSGSEDIIELNKVARADSGGMNLSEAQEHLKALPATVQEVAKEAELQLTAEQQTSEIKTNIKNQLVENVGMNAGTAQVYSQVLEGFRVLAERSGIDPQVLFDRYGLTVTGEQAVESVSEFSQQPVKFDSEEGSYTINEKNVKAYGELGTGDTIEDFVNPEGAGLDPIDIRKIGLDKFEQPFTIQSVKVKEGARLQGLGRDAVLSLEREAIANGADVILLNASPMGATDKAKSLPGLIKFYEGLGYKIIRKNKENADMYKPAQAAPSRKTLFQSALTDRKFYSKLQKTLDDKIQGESATSAQVKGLLKDLKPEEVEWSGINSFLQGKKKVNKQELLDYLKANELVVEPVVLGEAGAGEGIEYRADVYGDEGDYYNIIKIVGSDGDSVETVINNGPFQTEDEATADLEQEIDDREIDLDSRISGVTKFEDYTLPGGENYREILYRLPPREQKAETPAEASKRMFGIDSFHDLNDEQQQAVMAEQEKQEPSRTYKSGHFDQDNVLAHIRVNDRVDKDGNKVLYVEEIQSDWHQEGRKKGYVSEADGNMTELPEGTEVVGSRSPLAFGDQTEGQLIYSVVMPDGRRIISGLASEAEARERALAKLNREAKQDKVPDAPFKKTWHELALKNIIQMAVEGGYDKIAWAPGEVQAERYDLSKQVKEVKYKKHKNGEGYWLQAFAIDSNTAFMNTRNMSESEIEEAVGKDLAKKIIDGEGTEKGGFQSLSGLDLKVGGEGMKGFYDNILVKSANKLVKKLGGKVGSVEVETSREETFKSRKGNSLRASLKELKFKDFKKDEAASDKNRTVLKAEDLIGREHRIYIHHYKDDKVKYSSPEADVVIDYNNLDNLKSEIDGDKEETIQTQKSHSLDVTDKMKEFIQGEGFSLFQEGKRGKISFGGRREVNIQLLESADPSTFLHEMGHFYLEVLGDLSTGENAPKDLQDDFKTILDWMGIENREQIEVKHHEMFARGFEAFLMTGKAPSSKLRKAFMAFKTWLTTVYKNISNLDVNLTDEVRDVMSRLLASEVEIQAAQERMDIRPIFGQNPESFGMTGAKAKKYKQAMTDAQVNAEDEMLKVTIEGYKNKQEKDYKKKFQAEKEAVTEQVNSMKIYKALDALKEMQMPDGSPFKIDKGSILKYTDKENLKKMKGTYSAEGGIDVDVAASMLGYQDGKTFINEVIGTPKKADFIEALTNQRMAQKYPDIDPMLDEIKLEEDALIAIHNDKRAELLEMELQHLASNNLKVLGEVVKQVAKRPPKAKEVREIARTIISKLQVKNIRPVVYERAEAKAAKLSGEALAKGDFNKAYEMKRKELINFYLYKEAVDAKAQVEKGVKSFRKFSKKDEDLAKTRDINIINAGRSLLARFNLGKPGKSPESYLEGMKAYDPEAYDSMSILLETVDSQAKKLQDMSYDQYLDLKSAMDSLWLLAKSSRQIEIDGKKVSRDKAIEELSLEITKYAQPGDRPGYKKAMSSWDKTKIGLLGMRAALRRVESWADAMDLGKAGVFKKYIWNPISDATDQYRLSNVEYLKKFKELLEPIEKGLTAGDVVGTEIDYTFKDKAELLGAMLHTGNNSNKQKLLRGRAWAEMDLEGNLDTRSWDKFVQRMIDQKILLKADFDFMQSVWDLMEQIKPMAQKAHKEMYGHYFSEVTSNEFTNEFGTYRGGYMPAKADPNIVEDAAIRVEKDNIEKFNNSFAFPTTGRGATKKRVEEYAAPLIFDLRQVPQHIDWALRFSIIEPRVKDVAKIVTNKGFRETLAQLDPTIGSTMLVPWLQRAAAQKVETPVEGGRGWQLLARGAKAIRTNAGFSIMVGNVTNTLQQFTGLSIAAIKVKPKYLRNALWTYVTDGKNMQASAAEKSAFMNTRVATQVFDIAKRVDDLILNPTKYEKAKRFAQEHGYIMQAYTQNIVDNIVWSGAYDQAVERGATEKEAVREGNAAVRLTQGSFNAEDISAFETGTAFQRMFTMFYSYFNMQANLLGGEFTQIMREQGVTNGKGRMLYLYTFGFMIPAFMSEIIVKSMSGKVDEDDDDKYLDDYLAMFFDSQTRTGTAMFPFVGPVVQSGINAANDKWYDDRISTSPAVSLLESSVVGNVKNIKRAAEGKDVSSKRATRDALTAISIFTGIPVAPLSRPIGYAIDVKEGKAQPTGPIDFTRGLITGKSGE